MAKGGGGVRQQPISGGMSAMPGVPAGGGPPPVGPPGGPLVGPPSAAGGQMSPQAQSDKLYALQMAYANAANASSAGAARRGNDILKQIWAMGQQGGGGGYGPVDAPTAPPDPSTTTPPPKYTGAGTRPQTPMGGGGGGNRYRDLMANMIASYNRNPNRARFGSR